MTIRKLPESMVVRIAAGEVIERPASVVKELVENSFDAGARNIAVRIQRGGLGLIEVSDDGSGIPGAELPLAVERHATSKLGVEEDLHAIRTMGFRGEALAAIAAAGRLSIVSRTHGEDAMHLSIDDSLQPGSDGFAQVAPAARAPGTTVLVRELFAKTPARLKFMKSETAEFSRISEMLERLALARPDVAVSFTREDQACLGRQIFRTPGNGKLRDVVLEIFGANLSDAMLEVSGETSAGSVTGLVTPTHMTRRNRTGFFLNLDGRPIEDRTISHAITSAYEGLLPGGNFPIVFLTISLSPNDVDVNVHPAKAEVRFREIQSVHRLVSSALRARLRGDVALPTISTSTSPTTPTATVPSDGSVAPAPSHARVSMAPATLPTSCGSVAFQLSSDQAITPAEDSGLQQGVLSALFDQHTTDDQAASALTKTATDFVGSSDQSARRSLSLRYSGEIAGRYLLAETGDGLVIVDQHAAHERILFDKLMREAQNGEVVVSPLLTPLVIELPASDRAISEEMAPALAEIGIELEQWPDSIAVRSIPAVLSKIGAAERIIRDVISAVREGGAAKTYKVPYEKLAMEACKAAVKGTQRLHPEEAGKLLDDLRTTTDPYNCPHGRPTMIRMTIAELDRRFGR